MEIEKKNTRVELIFTSLGDNSNYPKYSLYQRFLDFFFLNFNFLTVIYTLSVYFPRTRDY